MIRVTSAAQARALRGQIPELMIRRMEQFEGSDGDFNPAVHGHLVFIGGGEDIAKLPEVSDTGLLPLLDPECPGYELLEVVEEGGQLIYEMVVASDAEKTIAVFFIDSPDLDRRLAAYLDQLTSQAD